MSYFHCWITCSNCACSVHKLMLNFMTFLTYISHLKYTCFKNKFPFAFKSVLIHGRRAKKVNEANANFWCPGLRSPELTKFIIRTILQMVLSKNQLQTHIYLEDDNIKFSLVHIKPTDSHIYLKGT